MGFSISIFQVSNLKILFFGCENTIKVRVSANFYIFVVEEKRSLIGKK